MVFNEEEQKKLIEAQILISQSLQGINTTLQKINDQNILHSTKSASDHQAIVDALKDFGQKWWLLIVILSAALIVLAGAEKIVPMIFKTG
jgi:hypothetical protein